MADYAEVLLEAMDIISKKQIDAVSFDKTIEATIINTSKAADGIYTVAYGNSKFTAYSTETAYRENDVVMVTVPQGNFDNQKIIIGKKVDDMNTPLVYKSPFQQIINVTNNLIEEDVGTFGCWANGGTTLGLENDPGWNLDVLDFKDSNAHTKPQAIQQNPDPKYYGLIWDSGDIFETQFTRLGLQAQFCTWLSEYNTTFGNYGLALQLTFKCVDIPDPATANDPPNTFYKIVTFDSNEFFGDVYNFETYYTQETVFDLTEFTDYPIVNIQLFGYQRNNFFNADGEDIYQNEVFTPDFTGGFMTINPNIFIKDPYICLGIAAEDFITDTATLITSNSLTYQKYYDNTQPGQDDDWLYTQNKKQVQLRWIHKFEKEDVIKAVEDNEFPRNYEIRWYRYQLGAKSPDQFAGAHWTRFYGIHSVPSKKTGEWVITQEEIQGNADLDLATDNIFVDFEPNINWQEEQLKAIVLKIESGIGEHQIYRLIAASNILTFTNDDNVRSQATIIDSNALAIVYEDEEKGHYFLYNRAGNISENEDKEVRTLKAVFDRDVNNVYEKADLNLDDCYSIKWIFPDPDANTMIIPMSGIDETAKPAQPTLDLDNPQDTKQHFMFWNKTKVGFTIKGHLNNNATQNTIRLEVVLKGETFTAQVQPIFGTAGTSGSDYTLVLEWENNENALNLSEQKQFSYKDMAQTTQETPGNESAISGKVYLFDQSGQIVDIQTEEAHYEFSWYRIYEPNVTNSLVKASNTMKYPVEQPNILEPLIGNGIPTYLIDANNSAQKYKYSLTDKRFIEDNNPLGVYYQVIGENNLDAIEFQAIPVTLGPDDDGYNPGMAGQIIGDGDNRAYYYSSVKRAFIKYNDIFIIDPWEEYSEVETYYEPVLTSEKVYNSQHLTIQTDYDEQNKGHVILHGNPSMNCLYILQVVLKDFGDYDLVARFPIPLKKGEFTATNNNNHMADTLGVADGQKMFVVDYIEGATDVRYATTGETDFNKNAYQITCRKYDVNTNDFITLRNGYSEAQHHLSGSWRIWYEDQDIDQNQESTNFLPELFANIPENQSLQDIQYLLHPPGLYFKETPIYGVQFIAGDVIIGSGNDTINLKNQSESLTQEETDNKFILWTQPIYSFQDNYPSTTLNKWNGKDIVTEDDTGVIVANGLAAGKKEKDNTFTGVTLGDWSRTDTDSFITKQTGVYGFNHGAMSYALKDDGTAFFGKDGRGRIYLSGNKAQIYSSEWLLSQEGMLLDIDNGYIKMIKKSANSTIPYYDSSSFGDQVSINVAVGNPMFYFQDYTPVKNQGNYWNRIGQDFIYIPITFSNIDSEVQNKYSYVINHYGYGTHDYFTAQQISNQSYFWYAGVSESKTSPVGENESQQSTSYQVVMCNITVNNNTLTIDMSGSTRPCLVKIEHSYETQSNEHTSGDQTSWQTQDIHIEKKTYYFLLDLTFTTSIQNNREELNLSSPSDILLSQTPISLNATTGYTANEAGVVYVRANTYQSISATALADWPTTAKGFYFVQASGRSSKIYIYDKSNEINYRDQQQNVIRNDIIKNMPLDIVYYTEDGSYQMDENNQSLQDGKYITLSVAEKQWPLAIGRNKLLGSRKFKVNWDGQLYAEDGVFSGKITSHEGEIGGWIIDKWMLYSKYQQKPTWEELNERGWYGVVLDARGGNIYGAGIYTHKGRIGGWWIKQNNLYGGDTMLHRSNGIITDIVKIKATADANSRDDFGDSTSWNYFGGVGYVGAQFQVGSYTAPGVGVFYGSTPQSSNAIYKVNGHNLGFKWFNTYMSINNIAANSTDDEDEPEDPNNLNIGGGSDQSEKVWRFSGDSTGNNLTTDFRIQDMRLFSVVIGNRDNNLSFEGNNQYQAFFFKSKTTTQEQNGQNVSLLDLATFKKDFIELKGGTNTYLRINNISDLNDGMDQGVFAYSDTNNYLEINKDQHQGGLFIKGQSGNLRNNFLEFNSNGIMTLSGQPDTTKSPHSLVFSNSEVDLKFEGAAKIVLTDGNAAGSIGGVVLQDGGENGAKIGVSSTQITAKASDDVKLTLNATTALLQRNDNIKLQLNSDITLQKSSDMKLELGSDVTLQKDNTIKLALGSSVTLQQSANTSLVLSNTNAVLKGSGVTLTVGAETSLLNPDSISITTGDFTLSTPSPDKQHGIYARFA